ncbi:caspase family protein [Fuscovulum ytuae]|uniref:Caspase family protein n=1 Tax=Fuscovulum ytuae TaxID=3042299 RepID=A0ABY8Q613_9RHOB|nr:caspase family protein [Fuscovulum sp. YMD61]WGV16276.1 caspase family protein [Fuscovulum sp. YMD61]
MTRKALICGIDFYESAEELYGCVNDAHSVNSALERHADGTINFATRLLVGTGPTQLVTRRELRQEVVNLFSGNDEIAILYFAGHGYIEQVGGYLICSDTKDGDDGLSLHEVMVLANQSKAKNRIIVLDCCHSGIAGNHSLRDEAIQISIGVTVLTASTVSQYASEKDGSGLFTSLLVDALNGGAANLLGDITPGSVYAHIDQSLGPWDQRPMFKTNVTTFTSLRKVIPPIPIDVLRNLRKYFDKPGHELQLDPSFEPDSPNPDPEKNRVFYELQLMAKVNLVRPVGEDHMYFAAMNSRSCRMTVLGEHYWRLIEGKII